MENIDWNEIGQATLDTLAMLGGSMALTVALGLPLGVILFLTGKGQMLENRLANGVLSPTGQRLVPFAGYAGAIRVAGGDFNGDGVQDYAFTVGAGPQSVVQIVDGRDGGILVNQTAIFPWIECVECSSRRSSPGRAWTCARAWSRPPIAPTTSSRGWSSRSRSSWRR